MSAFCIRCRRVSDVFVLTDLTPWALCPSCANEIEQEASGVTAEAPVSHQESEAFDGA